MNIKVKQSFLYCLLLGLLPALCMAAPPLPFEAEYGFYRNGKLAGQTRFVFESDGENWTLTTSSTGTQGLARFLGLEENSSSTGTWNDQGPVPLHYEQNVKVAIKTIQTSAEFDWQAMQAHSRFDDTEQVLELHAGVLDAVSEGLAIRAGLAEGQRQWQLAVLDEDEIEQHRYRAGDAERGDTALGCQWQVTVERIRGPESTRYTRTRYARDLDWVPLSVEHGKTDGEQMETRIESLRLDGRPVPVGAPCPAD